MIAESRLASGSQQMITRTDASIADKDISRLLEGLQTEVEKEAIQLLDDLHAALCRYVIFPSEETSWACTLWVVATHAQPAWEHAPRLVIISPEKRCGKSRLLDVIEAVACRTMVTVNISPAALARSIVQDTPPTILIDEADTIFGPKSADNHEDLRGIINSGHQRNRFYYRYDPAKRVVEKLPTFAMAALAGIGDLPDTVMDRGIVVRMRRRAPGESVDPYRTRRDRPGLDDLKDRLGWFITSDLMDQLEQADPSMPVDDRAADTWGPLVAIADAVGGQWPDRARRACLKITTAEDAVDVEGSLGVRLLGDIRSTFSDWSVTFLATTDIIRALNKIEDAPWRDLSLTARGLASRLSPYGIRSMHNAAKTARGYRLESFHDAWSRYLPSAPVHPSETGVSAAQPTDGSSGSIRPESVRGLSEEISGRIPDGSVDGNRPWPDQGKQHDPDAWTDADGSPGEPEQSPADKPTCIDCATVLMNQRSIESGRCFTCSMANGSGVNHE